MDESVHTVNAAAVVLAAAARSSTGLHRHHNHLQQQLLRDDHATAATVSQADRCSRLLLLLASARSDKLTNSYNTTVLSCSARLPSCVCLPCLTSCRLKMLG